MRAFSVLSAALLFAVSTWALTVTNPSQSTSWNAATRSQTVAWNVVTTDPSNVTISLVNMANSPPVSVVLKQNVLTSGGTTTVDGPSSGWPTGQGFQINCIQVTTTGTSILAQSEQFNITGSTVAFSSSISSSTGTSSGSSPSSTGSSGNGAMGLTVQAGFIAGLSLVGALLV